MTEALDALMAAMVAALVLTAEAATIHKKREIMHRIVLSLVAFTKNNRIAF